MIIINKKWKKYNKTQLTKTQMDKDNQKIKNYPPSPLGFD